jgi:hypothetical protein
MYSNAQIKWFIVSKTILNQLLWKRLAMDQFLKGFIRKGLEITYWKQMHKKKIHKKEDYGSTFSMFNCLDFTHPNPTHTWKHIKLQSNNWNVHISRFQSLDPKSHQNL